MEEKRKNSKAFRNFEHGDYSRSDYRQVEGLFNSEEDTELHERLLENWQSIPEGRSQSPQINRLIEQLHHIMFPSRLSVGKRALVYYQRVAAILLVPIFLAAIHWFVFKRSAEYEVMATIHSPEGARTSFVLPDGSTGWLNSGSELSYPVSFKHMREVKLVGEAFFHVKKQHGEKFRVRTNGLTVQVLGTQFNVSAYADDKQQSVVLMEGSVQILDKNEQPSYLMKPDERFVYNLAENKAIVSEVDAQELTSWTDGLLQFRGESLEEVMRKLARWYNVDIEIRDPRLREYSFKATFKDEQIEEILRMIALTTPMKYRIEERKTNQNGIYDKKKIIIEKK